MKYNSMDTAPKDGTRILVWEEEKDDDSRWMLVIWTDCYSGYGRHKPDYGWAVPESWGDEQGGYIQPLNPKCWTHLPPKPEMDII